MVSVLLGSPFPGSLARKSRLLGAFKNLGVLVFLDCELLQHPLRKMPAVSQ